MHKLFAYFFGGHEKSSQTQEMASATKDEGNTANAPSTSEAGLEQSAGSNPQLKEVDDDRDGLQSQGKRAAVVVQHEHDHDRGAESDEVHEAEEDGEGGEGDDERDLLADLPDDTDVRIHNYHFTSMH